MAKCECTQQKLLTDLDHIVNGNGKKGLKVEQELTSEKLNAIIDHQQSISAWVKWGISVTFLALVSALIVNIKDHYDIKRFPETYATKAYQMQVLEEMQRTTQAIENTALNNKDDIIELRRTLEYNSNFLKSMNVTRGGTAYKPPILSN